VRVVAATTQQFQEERFMLLKTAVAVLALSVTGAVSSAAIAAETGTAGCLHMQKQVTQALDANQQSPNFQDASEMRRAGAEFCQNGLYDQGLKRYAKALELLGTAGMSANAGTSTNKN
jgi:hypothetical protein